MPSLRDAITKTLLRLSKGAQARPSSRARSSKLPCAADRALQTGSNLGPYRIVKHLGAGGMGHVYLALHTRLGRHVALKFLPPDLTADEEMLRRLEGEAQAASRLNHPNILTIYDVGQLEGEHYIASEYVEGATLRSALERNVVDPAIAVDIVSQVLSALVEAHAAGVIHRDLKPGNIMIRRDGYVKVIDFGLAKQIRRSSSSGSTWIDSITRLGAIIGTVDYMSPEQARGDPVDHRTDLWSLGVILYEAVAHHRPFEGDTENHVIVNILDKPVSPMAEIPDLPVGLSEVIQRALAKDPAKRYQSAREMLADLQAIRRSSRVESGVYRSATPAKPRRAKSLVLGGVLFASLAALGVIWWFTIGRKQLLEPDWFRAGSIRRLTFNGQVVESCLSPDGKYLAYAAGAPNGLQTLYLSQLSTASEEIKIPARKISYRGLSFSPDDELYVVSEGDDLMGRLYRVSLIGNPADKPILTDIDGPVSFSPDGDRFAFVRWIPNQSGNRDQSRSEILTASRDGSQIHKLLSLQGWTILRQIAWSPKGDQIAATLFNDLEGHDHRPMLDLISLKGVERRLPLPDWQIIGQIWWAGDARSVILSSAARTEAPNQEQIREISIGDLQVHNITQDLAGYKSVSLTKNKDELAAIKEELKVSVWVSEPGDFARGQSTLAEAEQHPSLAWADKDQLLLNSQRSGHPNYWLFNIESQTRASFTNEAFVEQDVASIPGSKSVIFASNRTGEYKLWKFDPDTNAYVQLTFGPGYDESPTITPDGRWIVYTSWISYSPHLRRISIGGGTSVQIGSFVARWPQVSPDGKYIACLIENSKDLTWTAAVIPFDGSPSIRPIPEAQLPFHWYRNSETIAAVRDQQGISNVWAISLNGAAAYPVTHFEDQRILNFAFSPNEERIACLRGSLGSDVMLFTDYHSK